ncbi:ATP-binding protein [Altererythrobacter fulvus]|uniref:ATP-binding protein n=1 Tax=Caenibius fulvus TaxID=2126012 RepID=UPI00301776FD
MTDEQPGFRERLVYELTRLPSETGWVEFKHNNADPDMIGKTISALSNSAVLEDQEKAYLVWGVDDGTHAILGTTFNPAIAKKGNENLEAWLVRCLEPRLDIRFHSLTVNERAVVVLEIPAARLQPTRFSGREWIRVGSVIQPLGNHGSKEAELWRQFDRSPFEALVALGDCSGERVISLLDYPAYFESLGLPFPSNHTGILEKLEEDRLITRNEAGHFNITNLGAILFARRLQDFPALGRKAVRVIVYQGRSRVHTEREQEGTRGYAAGFAGLMEWIDGQLPRNEVIGQALRTVVPLFPELAVRELVANALIHQDFTIEGTGPMVEIFDGRIEITNPGSPLIDVERLLDHAPRSRNEALARFMRRLGICEERGSGVDKVVFETEFHQLPPPIWERQDGAFRVTLFAPKPLREMDRQEKVHACYLHACLRYVNREPVTNTSLRERFGVEAGNAAIVSRIIRDALEAGVIKPFEEGQAKKAARYLPWWA